MIKVLIVDDQVILRESIKFMLNSGIKNEIEVVGCASNCKEALAACEKLLPDIVLMDISMPDCSGIEVIRLIKARYASIKVIILTVFADEESILDAMKSGADGYILKSVDPEELISVIKNTSKGLNVLQHNIFNIIIDQLKLLTEFKRNNIHLPDREIQIIKSIVQGKSVKAIASDLHLSEGRIKNILSDIFTKLGLKDRVQLAVFAVKNGLA